jgi:hypothetical protein
MKEEAGWTPEPDSTLWRREKKIFVLQEIDADSTAFPYLGSSND